MGHKAIVYIGEFDLRNENVQAHLVKNNGKILNSLGYDVYYVGTNRECSTFDELNKYKPLEINYGSYYELPHTLTIKGVFEQKKVTSLIIDFLSSISSNSDIAYVITYQAPTYASVLKKIALWCKGNRVPYIVNCADLPVFDSQPVVKRIVMKCNWRNLHRINKKYADGVISVSRFIDQFYAKEGRPSVIIPPLFDEPKFDKIRVEANPIPVFIYAGTPFIITGSEINTRGMKDRLDKIIDLMIEMEEKGISFRLDVVGITSEDYCKCIPRHHEKINKSKNINFYGRQSHEDTLMRIISADFMINFRDKNKMTEAGLSTKVVESVSLGTPVVMNDIGDTFIYLKDNVSGIRLVGDKVKDCNTLKRICDLSKNERTIIKNKCRDCSVFSISKYTREIESFLLKVRCDEGL